MESRREAGWGGLDHLLAMSKRDRANMAAVSGLRASEQDHLIGNFRTDWTAGEILDLHTQLTERYVRPDANTLDFLDSFIEDAVAQNGRRAAAMFRALDLYRSKDHMQQARHLAGEIARGLRNAVTYEVTPEMAEVLWQVHKPTIKQINHLDEAEVPVPAGFVWFDKPLPLMDVQHNTLGLRAISWELVHWYWNDGQVDRPAVWVVLWAYTGDAEDVGDGSFWGASSFPDQAEYLNRRLGPLVVLHSALMPFGVQFTMGDEPDPDGLKELTAKSVVNIVHVLWMFLGMEIVSTRLAEVPRPMRRRAQKSLVHGEVNVILLRRIAHPDDGRSVTSREVDWSCRWIVQGHYRHIEEYDLQDEAGQVHRHRAVPGPGKERCAICDARITYVRPYIKGPDGKPLKAAGPTLLKLAR